nr:hypothetical protein [SAR92 clade bacterium]
MDLFPKDGGSCVKAGLPSITPTYGLKQHVFVGGKSANDADLTSTRIVSTGMGCSLICPINVLGTNTASTEYQYSLGLGPQLPLPFNVHRIDHGLSLAPNGRWSKFDYHINKDGLVDEFLKDFRRFTILKRLNKKVYFEAFDMVLANLMAVHYSSSQLLLARSNGKYKSSNPLGIDNRTITFVTDYLADRGLIDLHIGKQNDTDKNSSWCIPLLPLVALLDRYDARIRLHAKTQFAVVRDDDKNAIPMYSMRSKRLRLIKLGEPVREH